MNGGAPAGAGINCAGPKISGGPSGSKKWLRLQELDTAAEARWPAVTSQRNLLLGFKSRAAQNAQNCFQ